MKNCPTCGVEVVVGENITESQMRHYSYTCRPCRTAVMKELRKNNPEHYAQIWRDHRNKWKDDPEWRGRRSFYQRSRHAKMLEQTPEDADMDLIKEFYENRELGMTVDHIIPLDKGGLHHQDNLQYLTKSENSSKGNRL